jgi:ABC-type transport system involved in multi-copper enzyme maturation permease subunit
MKALQIEFIKLFRPSTYVILAILLLVVFIRGEFGMHLVSPDLTGMLKSTDAGMADMIGFIFSIFVIMNIGQEYTENTLRRSIIEGYTRGKFFIGKILLVIVAAVLLLLVQKLIFLALAASAGYTKEAFDCLTVSGAVYSLIRTILYALLGFFLIFLTRSVAISIIISFVWTSVEGLLSIYLKFKYPGSDWGSYLPFSSLAQILATDGTIAFQFVFIALGYQVALVAGSYGLLATRDIK